jgi:uncharacterized membrane protein
MLEYSSNSANSLIHLYRAEVGKMVLYRVRLDTTTNWAIVTTAGVTTFALADPRVPHAVFLFAMALVYFFLHLESRRFLAYMSSKQRVQLLERHFYANMLGEGDTSWQQQLLEDLKHPTCPVGRLTATGWRLRRNYLWIYGALILAWGFKLDFLDTKAETFAEFARRAAVGPMPGWLTVLVVGVFYLTVFVLALYASTRFRLENE